MLSWTEENVRRVCETTRPSKKIAKNHRVLRQGIIVLCWERTSREEGSFCIYYKSKNIMVGDRYPTQIDWLMTEFEWLEGPVWE